MTARSDPKSRTHWKTQPLAVIRAVAPLRLGPQGELRQAVRCLLLQAMGFECGDIPLNAQIPHQFPRGRFTDEDKYEFAIAAHDGLRELGYDAAADILARRDIGPGLGVSVAAKDALVNLESGPPSVMLGGHAIYTHSLRKYRDDRGNAYLVGRRVGSSERAWYRFFVGVRTPEPRPYGGWDPEGGFTFQRCGRTLADVLAPLYGSAELEEELSAGRKPRRSPGDR